MAPRKILRFRKVSAGWGIVSLLILLLLSCSAYLMRPAIRARYLFGELETLQLGHSTFEDAQRLAKRIGANPYGPCDRSSCVRSGTRWSVRIGNSELPRWWRGPGEALRRVPLT